MSQFCLKWNNHVPNLLAVFENMKSMDSLVDVTLSCEGRIVKAHKLVLSAGSKFFQSLFLSHPCAHPVIIMHNIKYNVLKSIIEFMYKGEVSVVQEHLEILLKTAKTLDIKGLAEISEKPNVHSDTEQSSTSVLPNVPCASNAQPNNAMQHLKRRKARTRKRSNDSNCSNDDVHLKVKQSLFPENQDLSVEPVDNDGPVIALGVPLQQISSAKQNVICNDNTSSEAIMLLSGGLREQTVEQWHAEEQSDLESPPMQHMRNNETLSNVQASFPDTIGMPPNALSSSQLLDPNDSEDGDLVDIKPHFLRFYNDDQRPLAEYLGNGELCTLYQRCRNPSQFAVNMARMLFTPDELRESNCRGVKDKSALDRKRLQFIRSSVMKFYDVSHVYEIGVWKQCMQSIDSRCRHERRPKFRNPLLSFGFSDEN